MTVYNVGGVVSMLVASEEAAHGALQGKVSSAEMDLIDVTTRPHGPGYVAEGTLVGLFEAEGKAEAMSRFSRRVLRRTGLVATGVDAFESEPVPQEWVR